jgi:ribosomal protein S18 acetylase RimI-like enzyme
VTPLRGSLRRARSSDLPRLGELWIEIATHHGPLDPLFSLRPGAAPQVERLFRAVLDDPDAAVFVWEVPDDLLGFCAVRIDRAPPILQETRRAEITDLGVSAAARRGGIGRELFGAALAWAKERGIERLEVRVAARNREGQAFWRRLGFDDLIDVLHRRV